MSLERNMLDQTACVGELEACRYGFAASLQKPQTPAEFAAYHDAVPPEGVPYAS